MMENLKTNIERQGEVSDNHFVETINKKIDFDDLARRMESKLFQNPKLLTGMADLVEKLKDRIGDYNTILGEGSGSRLPSLFLTKLINKQRELQDRGPVAVYFLATGKYGSDESQKKNESKIEEFVKSKSDLGKILVVTEYIDSGESIVSLVEALERIGIDDFDIATISIHFHPDADPKDDRATRTFGRYDERFTKRLIYGAVGTLGWAFFKKTNYAGVEKNYSADKAYPTAAKLSDRSDIKRARNDVETLANAFLSLLENKGDSL